MLAGDVGSVLRGDEDMAANYRVWGKAITGLAFEILKEQAKIQADANAEAMVDAFLKVLYDAQAQSKEQVENEAREGEEADRRYAEQEETHDAALQESPPQMPFVPQTG